MRDEKEERKKQARSNKQTRQSNTAHPRQSLFLEKMSCLRWDSNPRHSIYSRQSALPTELPRQLSWLGPNLTSHSTPDEQANHQLSMKEKAGVMKPPMTPNTKHVHEISVLATLLGTCPSHQGIYPQRPGWASRLYHLYLYRKYCSTF